MRNGRIGGDDGGLFGGRRISSCSIDVAILCDRVQWGRKSGGENVTEYDVAVLGVVGE